MGRNRRKTRNSTVVADFNSELHPVDMPFNAQVAVDVVDNPNRIGPVKISVTRSIRNDPLAGMLSRSQIDRAQFNAGRRWQRYHEMIAVGVIIAMDPLKEPVDGRGPDRSSFSDAQLNAFQELRHARTALGRDGYQIVQDVLGDGLSIVDVAKKRFRWTEADIKYIGKRFRECLETLAVHWGYASPVHHDPQRMRPR